MGEQYDAENPDGKGFSRHPRRLKGLGSRGLRAHPSGAGAPPEIE